MKYTNKQIRENIQWFVKETNQTELPHVIAFCLGYYGYITKQIWNEIIQLYTEDVLQF